MDMTFSAEDIAFRGKIRAFLKDKLPKHLSEAKSRSPQVFSDYAVQMEWQSILHRQGWVGYRWPEAYGGTGWSPVQCYIFDTECAKVNAPELSPLGLKLVGPVIYTYGTDAQKKHYLPRVLSGEDYWCQGFSEPGSGSDLASLKTKAIPDGDDYIVDGTKIWTSLAHHANWIFCLVRTDNDVKAQQGISFLLINMDSPGVDVEPIITMAGDHEVNQVFFDNVRVTKTNLVGQEGQGWDIAKFLLANERGGSFLAPPLFADMQRLKNQALQQADGVGGTLFHDPDFSLKYSKTWVELKALEVTELRTLEKVSRGEVLGPQSSIAKLIGSNLRQKVDELRLELFGNDGMELVTARPLYGTQSPEVITSPDAQLAMPGYLNNRAWTIFGGSDEVQKTILAKTVLGL